MCIRDRSLSLSRSEQISLSVSVPSLPASLPPSVSIDLSGEAHSKRCGACDLPYSPTSLALLLHLPSPISLPPVPYVPPLRALHPGGGGADNFNGITTTATVLWTATPVVTFPTANNAGSLPPCLCASFCAETARSYLLNPGYIHLKLPRSRLKPAESRLKEPRSCLNLTRMVENRRCSATMLLSMKAPELVARNRKDYQLLLSRLVS
eukprot:2941190-Rhodomonas_salina.3